MNTTTHRTVTDPGIVRLVNDTAVVVATPDSLRLLPAEGRAVSLEPDSALASALLIVVEAGALRIADIHPTVTAYDIARKLRRYRLVTAHISEGRGAPRELTATPFGEQVAQLIREKLNTNT